MCSKRFPGPSSPPGLPSVTTAVSESSSCGSDSSERISCYKRQVFLKKIFKFIQSCTFQLHFVSPKKKFQIENEVDTEVFECKSGGRRSSASTNNNNSAPSDPGSPKTVRSRY